AVVAEGKIFVVGGICKTGEFPTQIDVFDPLSNEWSIGPKLQSGRSGHMCAVLGKSIVVFGGSSVMGTTSPSINATMETIQIHPSPSQNDPLESTSQ
ncbi:MAG TPA: kelch repeat-containing protein, partial [Candidatus Hydrogenedens sp.]|nr:kelch repeat-containing protein [Candidatus Hydrogenedens sp.]